MPCSVVQLLVLEKLSNFMENSLLATSSNMALKIHLWAISGLTLCLGHHFFV